MLVGAFADSHDHLDNIRTVVDYFNHKKCDLVVFAGDLVSTICVPPLRKLACPLVASYGDNEGNKVGLQSGFALVGTLSEPPVLHPLKDGTRIVVVHMLRQLRNFEEEYDIAVYAHTHKPRIHHDEQGHLFVNPGETGGWTFRQPTVAMIDTTERRAWHVPLDQMESKS